MISEKMLGKTRRVWLLLTTSPGWFAHLVWGFLLLRSSAPRNTTPVHTIANLFPSDHVLSFVLLAASGVAIYACLGRMSILARILLLTPQQLFLFWGAGQAVFCVVKGTYADGVPRPYEFIAADQIRTILAALLHMSGVTAYAYFMTMIQPDVDKYICPHTRAPCPILTAAPDG